MPRRFWNEWTKNRRRTTANQPNRWRGKPRQQGIINMPPSGWKKGALIQPIKLTKKESETIVQYLPLVTKILQVNKRYIKDIDEAESNAIFDLIKLTRNYRKRGVNLATYLNFVIPRRLKRPRIQSKYYKPFKKLDDELVDKKTLKDNFDHIENQDMVETILGDVKEKYRKVATLILMDGFTGQEAAKIMGCTRSEIFRCMRMFKKNVKKRFTD